MKTTLLMHISTEEICRLSNINTSTIIEIVEHGIIQPKGGDLQLHEVEAWLFEPEVVSTVKKAARLHYDLDIDWAGIAFAIDLLKDLDDLRCENRLLKQRLEKLIQY